MQKLEKLKTELEGIDIRFNEPLSQYTYTKVGGAADFLVFPAIVMSWLVLSILPIKKTFLGWCWEMPVISL